MTSPQAASPQGRAEAVWRGRRHEQTFLIRRVPHDEIERYVVKPPNTGKWGTHEWTPEQVLTSFDPIERT